MLFRKKEMFFFLFLLCPEKKNIFWLSDCEKNISVFLSEENLEEKTQPPPPPKIKWSVPRQAHMVPCYFLVYFHCNKQYKKQIKQTGIPGISFFTVIFTDTTETLIVSPAG